MDKCLPLATTVFISDRTGETGEEEARTTPWQKEASSP